MILLVIAVIICGYLAFCVGVNAVGSVLGITMGSGVLKLRTAVVLAGACSVLGAYFFSRRIISTLSEHLVHLDTQGVVLVIASASILLVIITYKGIPIFETYLIIGAISGYSLMKGLPFDMTLLGKILASLFISPLAAVFAGYVLYSAIQKLAIRKLKSIPQRENFERKFFIPAILALLLLCFTLGANSIGVVLGILGGHFAYTTLGLLGGSALLLGVFTWSYKIAKTVGLKLTDLSPTRGFSAHLAAGLVLLFFISQGIPISTTQTVVGATIGVGLARGKLEPGTMHTIAFSWLVGLPAAIGIAALLGWLI